MPSEISPDVIIFAASISACERGSQWQKASWKFLRNCLSFCCLVEIFKSTKIFRFNQDMSKIFGISIISKKKTAIFQVKGNKGWSSIDRGKHLFFRPSAFSGRCWMSEWIMMLCHKKMGGKDWQNFKLKPVCFRLLAGGCCYQKLWPRWVVVSNVFNHVSLEDDGSNLTHVQHIFQPPNQL